MRIHPFVLVCVVLVLVGGALRQESEAGTRPAVASQPVWVPNVEPDTTLPPPPPPPPPPPTTTTTAEVIPPERTAFIVGDSLTEGAAPFIADALHQMHWAAAVDFRHGRKTAEGLAVLAAHRNDLPPTVVVALGTNDVTTATPQDVNAWLSQARAIVGNRRLIWVNLQLNRPEFANYVNVDNALAVMARRYKVEVADWATWSARNGVQHVGDGIHYPLPGCQRRAEFYARILARQ